MRYLSTNKDGSIATWATVPLKLVRNEDKKELPILGIRRKDGKCWLYGIGFEFPVGDENFDVSDMPSDHIPGVTVVFPEFEKDILAKLHKDTQEQIVSWRRITRSELTGDRQYRAAWRDAGRGQGIRHDMGEVRGLHLKRLRDERNKRLDAKDKDYTRATGQGKKDDADRIEKERQALRDAPAVAQEKLDAANTIEEVKAITLDTLV